jgi:hypothetical protein
MSALDKEKQMDKKQVILIALFGAAVGCAATQVAQVQHANAQQAPGHMRECAAVQLGGLVRASNLARGAVQMPPGWTIVGGTTADDTAGVVVCR